MAYKLVAMDLDETLLNDDHVVPEENLKWIRKARKDYGVRFVAATGRGFCQIVPELKQLGIYDAKDEYTLSFNGGAITENKDNRMISWRGLSFDKMKEIFTFGLTKDVCIHVYTDTTLYVYNLSEDEKERLTKQKLGEVYPKENSVDFLKNEKIAKILFQNVNVDYLKSLENEIMPITKGYCEISYSSNRYMEFNAKGVDKGSGLRELAEKLNVSIEETIAVGDNYNDLAMLKAAGLSVAAQNAVDEVKDICDYVTIADNNEGVIAELIRKYIYHENI